jgi:glutamyl-Q tRNA(Asp) synthetase
MPLLKQGSHRFKPRLLIVQSVFRFAPSPNGELHLGHAYSALLNDALCRRAGGRLLLRIEDIDPVRSRKEFEAGIHEDLAWLSIEVDPDVRRQSEHMGAYGDALRRLRGMGLVYPSFMSRTEIAAATAGRSWPRDPDGAPLYPGLDRNLASDEADRLIATGAPYAFRLKTDEAVRVAGPLSWIEEGKGPSGETGEIPADPPAWGDVILARKETPTSYHLSVVVDDAAQGVTHVVRGRDLFHATAVHVLLQRLLELPTPVYRHHRLITDASGRKLSKSDRDTSLRALRDAGVTPEDVRRMVGIAAGD